MSENIPLEDLNAVEFRALPLDTVVRSQDGKMLVVKRKLYWEILCGCLSKNQENPHGKYLCITYNENYLGRIFGRAVNSYTNYVAADDSIAKHYHQRIKEIFRVESLDFSLEIALKDAASGERTDLVLDGKPVEFEGKKYLREIVILEDIAHRVHNPHGERVALAVTTSGEHTDDDVFAFDSF